MDDWKLEDILTSVQAQMQELERIAMRVAIHKRLPADTKRKVALMLADINKRFQELP